MASDVAEIAARLTAFVQAKTCDPRASISPLETLPGHAGLSFSFVLESRTAEGKPVHDKLVIRLAPEGVRISGPADVVRQARVMASLVDTAVPVPPVRWFDDDPKWFSRPFFVVGFVDGEKLADREREPAEKRLLAKTLIETLAALHGVEWQPRRAAWGEPFALTDELKRLDYLLDRPTLDATMIANAPRLRERLRESLPAAARIGCVHGDYQWSNAMFRDGKVSVVFDWEISMIGATLLDVGWLCLFSDPDSWAHEQTPAGLPSLDELIGFYIASAHFPVLLAEVRWFQAFSAYRFGVITAFNVMLHRRGKRHDPMWETVALSGARLFERGLELAG